MEKRRNFRKLVGHTCFTILWQFVLCILLLYIFPLMGILVVALNGSTKVFLNVFSWVYICVVLLILISFHMGRMLKKIKGEMDAVYRQSTWVENLEEKSTDGIPDNESLQKNLNLQRLSIEEFYQTSEHISKMKERILQMIEHEKGQKEELAFQVAAASHDLKTPLTVIKGNGELLQMSLQDEKALQCVDDLLIAGNRMETYVRELIGYTKTYSVGTDQIRSCRLCDLVGELKEQAVQIVAGTKEISFAFQDDAKEDGDNEIKLYEDYVIRAFSNLISNACAYSGKEPGQIRISIALKDMELTIKVWNDNSKVSEDLVEHFGTLFYREDSSRNGKEEHYGIGLAFVKRVADMHSGQAWIKNVDDGVEVGMCIHTKENMFEKTLS